jgi:hypothetical protein
VARMVVAVMLKELVIIPLLIIRCRIDFIIDFMSASAFLSDS